MSSLPAKLWCSAALWAAAASLSWGQQYSFNDGYLLNAALLDPSFAGQLDHRFAMGYQQKWIGIEGAPRSMAFAGDFNTKNFNLQASLLGDQAGPLTRVTPSVTLAKTIQLDDYQKLSFGLKMGVDNWNIDYSKPELDVPIDPAFSLGNQTLTLPNFGFGLSYNFKDWAYIGFSTLDLSSRGWSPLTTVPSHRHVFAGVNVPVVNKSTTLRLSAVFNQVQNAPVDANYHAILAHKTIGAGGLVLSPKDGIGIALSTASNRPYRVFYNYTYPLNPLQAFTRQSHTIGLSLTPKRKPCSIAGPRYF
jgi:type IX secretion system PorP/SprF family membrane protein